ncbi:MAG: DUF4157 domain-containing protein, partial [Actinomycetota bacterium]|nr:DUF4157 domain-containing protein [Actinomycetota bacterium]
MRRRGDVWVWVGGPVPPGSAAITLGRLVIVRRSAAGDERLMRHELVHVRQWRELGVVGFLVRYLGAYFRGRCEGHGHWDAYRRIPLEVQADHEAAAWSSAAWSSAAGSAPAGS